MPTSARGSSPRRRALGFTLIELMVVVAIIAIAAGVALLALPDPNATRLERDAARLVALLEGVRAEARAAGLDVRWVPVRDAESEQHFRFVGLPAALATPTRWLDPEVTVEVADATFVVLGPEPILPPQRLVLRLGEARLTLASDGLAPFAVVVEPS